MTCAFRLFFFFNDTATTEIYTLSLHDALPISRGRDHRGRRPRPLRHSGSRGLPHSFDRVAGTKDEGVLDDVDRTERSEEHTSELQSQSNLVCRLLLEKKHWHRRPGVRFRFGFV